jgi:dipeptidyl aminopeptidase/acylaminoacyl peptidase
MSLRIGAFIKKICFSVTCIVLLGIISGCQQNLVISSTRTQAAQETALSTPSIIKKSTMEIIPTVPIKKAVETSTSTPALQPNTNPTKPPDNPAVSLGTGWQLAFASTSEGEEDGIYVFSREKNEFNRLTEKRKKPATIFLSPSWSPDGKKIAYVMGSIGINYLEIRIDTIAGTGSQKLINGYNPVWSPDGNEILYGYNNDIYKIDTRTQIITPLRITEDLIEISSIWSPDGKQIAYVEYSPHQGGQLFIMNADGKASHKVDMDTSVPITTIAWSPDGNRMAFGSHEGCGEIYLFDLRTKEISNLTNSPADEHSPSWSPDGEWIVYSGSNPDQSCLGKNGEVISLTYNIFVMKSDGDDKQMLGPKNLTGSDPVFSPVVPLELNKKYIVTVLGDKLLLRDKPSLTASYSQVFAPGAQLLTLEGPQMGGKDTWWRVKEVSTGLEGWVREGAGWLRPAGQDTLQLGPTVTIGPTSTP